MKKTILSLVAVATLGTIAAQADTDAKVGYNTNYMQGMRIGIEFDQEMLHNKNIHNNTRYLGTPDGVNYFNVNHDETAHLVDTSSLYLTLSKEKNLADFMNTSLDSVANNMSIEFRGGFHLPTKSHDTFKVKAGVRTYYDLTALRNDMDFSVFGGVFGGVGLGGEKKAAGNAISTLDDGTVVTNAATTATANIDHSVELGIETGIRTYNVFNVENLDLTFSISLSAERYSLTTKKHSVTEIDVKTMDYSSDELKTNVGVEVSYRF